MNVRSPTQDLGKLNLSLVSKIVSVSNPLGGKIEKMRLWPCILAKALSNPANGKLALDQTQWSFIKYLGREVRLNSESFEFMDVISRMKIITILKISAILTNF